MYIGGPIFHKKTTRHEGMVLEKVFWEMINGIVDVLPVYVFSKTNSMMVTNMKDYVTLDPDDDDDADFRYNDRDSMIAQFKQYLCNKNFGLHDQGKGDQIDTLQNRIKLWPNIIDMGGPIPDNLYEYDYNDEGLDHSVRGAEIFPEIRDLKSLLHILRYK